MNSNLYVSVSTFAEEALAETVQTFANEYGEKDELTLRVWKAESDRSKWIIDFESGGSEQRLRGLVNLLTYPFANAKFDNIRGFRGNRIYRIMLYIPEEDQDRDVCYEVGQDGTTFIHGLGGLLVPADQTVDFHEPEIDTSDYALIHTLNSQTEDSFDRIRGKGASFPTSGERIMGVVFGLLVGLILLLFSVATFIATVYWAAVLFLLVSLFSLRVAFRAAFFKPKETDTEQQTDRSNIL